MSLRVATSRDTSILPVTLMIVGAPKAGTTSLKTYLGQHPAVCTHPQREMIFFASDEAFSKGYADAYRVHFSHATPSTRAIVGKSVAMMYSEMALERLREHNPEAHVVLALRDPVERTYSEYWYARRRGWEPFDSFEAALADDGSRFDDRHVANRCAYVERSTYAPYVSRILCRFGPDRSHFVLDLDLRRDAVAVCRSLFEQFPGVDPDFLPSAEARVNEAALPRSRSFLRLADSADVLPGLRRIVRTALPRRSRQRLKQGLQRLNERPFSPPPIRPETRRELGDHFRPLNERLSELVDRDLSHWDHGES